METFAASPNESIAENSIKSNAVLDALLGAGIEQENIQTSEFNFSPVFTHSAGITTLTGYRVTNRIRVTVNDTNIIGTLLDLLIEAGASRIDSIRFDAENTETFKKQALLLAAANAKSRALILAKASSVSLGKVISIDATNGFLRNGVVTAATASGASASPILAGSKDIVATVTIKYAVY
jgi:uncharacterized protein YggE